MAVYDIHGHYADSHIHDHYIMVSGPCVVLMAGVGIVIVYYLSEY